MKNFFGNSNSVSTNSGNITKGNFFDTKKAYGGKWQPVDERKFTEEEKAMIAKAIVVASDYGLSCCFFMKSGDLYFQPMAKDSQATCGDELDIDEIKIITLSKTGSQDIERIKE